ncbi:hypothetical protein [Motilibacter aurantiacus]|uniref:hypothetical protein n=1 Tax=Motilibacter aurantiacus TaxID=2714955 RepID=UPI00140CC302|nr:hypothetical protein [Motilibacter aurantiacus]NHC44248.1 hypothetical protein [Motilibacter aurantiacus]
MRHPTESALRRLLDEPAGVADADRRHVLDCTRCLGQVAEQRRDAERVGAALETPAPVDVKAGWQRLAAAAAAPASPAPARSRPTRPRALLRRPAAAALGVAVVLAGAGTAAANDWLTVFRTEKVAPVGFASADLVALPDLEAYGDITDVSEPRLSSVDDASAAAAASGLDVPRVGDLPRGVTGEPDYQVGSRASATFTFSAEQAAQAAAATGEQLPPVPPGLDGASVRMTAGPGVAEVWESSSGLPALVVARAVAPSADSSGVAFAPVRDYLLSLPGLPVEVAAQLRTFTADGSTLPLPVPTDQVSMRSAQVDGAEATVLTTRDTAFSAVVWVSDGLVTVVAGSPDEDELLTVARELG